MNTQIKVNIAILTGLINLAEQFKNDEYANPLDVLSGNSIGKHVRHIIEFYEGLIKGYDQGVVNYDLRERNKNYEDVVSSAIEAINSIIGFISNAGDKHITLYSAFEKGSNPVVSTTTFSRELIYNIEHTIHHMAIIKIAVKASFPSIKLPENFGVAYSTVQHIKEQCAQ